MIEKKTLFVLGAGASAHLDFPSSGTQLSRNIVIACVGAHHPPELEWDRQKVKEFGIALNESGASSIDEFLEHNPKFLEVGKSAIDGS